MILHPLTIADIELQGERVRMSDAYTVAPCSCYVPDDPSAHPYDPCQYHDGYNDGIEALLAEMRKAVTG